MCRRISFFKRMTTFCRDVFLAGDASLTHQPKNQNQLERVLKLKCQRRKNMQIFPSFETVGKLPGHQRFELAMNFLDRSDADFMNIFNLVRPGGQEDTPFQAAWPASPPESLKVRSDQTHISPITIHDDPSASAQQKNLPANREDFARLREKLEHFGVDKDVLDRAEELFDRAGLVTWGQVYEVLRESLEKKSSTKLSTEQQQNILSLFNKMGLTPQDAKAMLNDILNNRPEAVWKKVQDMLASLTNSQKIFVTSKEISSLLKALGLDPADLFKSGLKKICPEMQAMLQQAMLEQKLSPELQSALQTVLAAAKAAALGETKPSSGTLSGETLCAMQKIVEAALKGEIKLAQHALDSLKTAMQNATPGVNLEQFLKQFTGDALSPEEMRKLLAMIKDAALANNQSAQANNGSEGGILSAIHKAMAEVEIKEQHSVQANRLDNGPTMPRPGQGDVLNAMKNTNENGALGNQNSERNALNTGDKNAQGWNNFWDKVNVKNTTVKNTAEGAGTTLKDIGTDTRPVVGQALAATATEAAARKVIDSAPAPQRTVLQQVYSGLLQNMGQGRQQLTLQLNPPELGSLTVRLKVFGKEVHAVLRAENQETRQILTENLPLLRQSLEMQGLKVSRLEVQSQMQEQNQFTQLWQGMDGWKFQEQDAKTLWGALGRGQVRADTSSLDDSSDQGQTIAGYNAGRPGGIDLIA
jgi:flagellar hook-length control protein FliK